jgi:hypothetical protein
MAGRYLLIRRKTSKAFVGAVPIKPRASSSTVLKVARQSIKPGLSVGPIVSSAKLKQLIIKRRPKTAIKKTSKRKRK